MTEILARLAVRAARVLVVEVPGRWATRVELEQQMLRRGWRPAWTPADADVLAVCGAPGPELTELVERLWEQMPGPRVRADIASPGAVRSALDAAAALLLDTPHHRTDARERAQEPEVPEDSEDGGPGGMDHGGMDHGGHGGMDHGGHEGMDHGDMDMAPAGIPLAQGGEDRDGLEMDVLHLPLGPVLPFWPAGLVLRCSLQGDVVVDAEASVVDAEVDHAEDDAEDDAGSGAAGATGPRPGPAFAAAVRCDRAEALLALAGAEDAAARARRARDALLRGDEDAARDAVERLDRTVRRSWLLRSSLRGVLPLDRSDLEGHGLPPHCRGDAHDRLLSLVERAREAIGGAEPALADGRGVPWAGVPWTVVPQLVTGLELASVRLAVASLDLDPFPVRQEPEHV
ncbi:hypothetical protein [Kocuria kalidii]|uniref:hypothetical protein n=1 Tax=Kocuria kalidii TaxID=3376283 RepID=UPI0037A0E51E